MQNDSLSRTGLTRRGLGGLAAGLAASTMLAPAAGLAQGASSANLAMVGEPQSLDPMASTADLVGTIMQHVYEPLFTFDANWATQPMLAASLPAISADGKTYGIELRKGVKLHNGRDLDAEDVVASLKRWLEMTPRGKGLAKSVASLTAKGPSSVEIVLNKVEPALLAHLALPSGFAAIMAKESIANPLTEFVGTGPYKFRERKPDQFVVLVRHDGYASRSEPTSGYAGKREAKIDELRFIPVPNANTRLEGVIAGQYQFSDQLPVESFKKLSASSAAKAVLTMPFGFPYFPTNTKQGPMADLKVRQAFQMALDLEEVLMAGFGEPKFFALAPAHFPKGSPFFSEAGKDKYSRADVAGAKKLLAEAKYDGTPIRILNSKQYDFHHRMALVMAEQMKAAGFKVQLDVVDWATLIQRRGDPALWDVYITHSAFLPEPMLSPPQLGDGAPGWWSTPAKEAALTAFNAEPDPVKRGALWGKVQQVIFDEVPYIRAGNFAALSGASAKMKDFTAMPWPSFWNVDLDK
ncbi:ABC transporter substrate-binding protein [Bosea sp. (in: a-proteobacteria)]|uniref:ABC transporter substrate-binding protein n=1 Tax=Bosea sp. (in: a-proteobacteria) TaxID=1871050 RepID=UPI00260F8837|nr:ABC transporter substrate-binding protein [Bosea sp. (in: a-proteobacteria)]MCO5090018.1 ABC transporter substrate-binding protein [Bosea sp. (in: a-proteobacteria)]